jgi:cyclopropane fatty-acyl-phospholipid synthase-like methyltransferase
VTFVHCSPSVSEWHKQFKEDHKNVEDDENSLRSHRTNKNAEKVQNLMYSEMFKYHSYGCATKFWHVVPQLC